MLTSSTLPRWVSRRRFAGLTNSNGRRVGTRATLFLVSLTIAGGALAAPVSLDADRLQDVRVCGGSALDRTAGECTHDQSASPILDSSFYCSAQARGNPGEQFSGRFFYRGVAFPLFGTSVSDKRRGLYIYLTAGPNPMPGGNWACELRVGPEHVRKTFRSAGPSGPILYGAVCSSSHSVQAGAARVCRRDESASAFGGNAPVLCSAVFAGGKGKQGGFEFLHEGKSVGLSEDFELPYPVTAAGFRLSPEPRLPPGRWTCRWTLAGRVVASKPFRISS